jgi:tetratricopeptide (TPR) repeat protein
MQSSQLREPLRSIHLLIDDMRFRRKWVGGFNKPKAKQFSLAICLGVLMSLTMLLAPSKGLASPNHSSVAGYASTLISSTSPFRAGVQFSQDGDYHSALIQFSKAIQNNREIENAYANRCLTFIQLNQPHEAIADCSQAISLNPSHLTAYLNRGLAYYRMGDSIAAIEDFTTVLEHRPYDAQAYYNRGLAKAVRGHFEQSINDFNQALRHVHSAEYGVLANIYSDRAITRLQQGDAVGAIADLSLALRLNSGQAETYFNRGFAYQTRGAIAEAKRDFTSAIQQNPDFAPAYLNRGLLHYRLGHDKRALDDIKAASLLFQHQGETVAHRRTSELLQTLYVGLSVIS